MTQGSTGSVARLLAGDPVVRLALGIFAVSFVPHGIPGLGIDRLTTLGDFFFATLLVVALWSLRRGLSNLGRLERPFWSDLSVAYGCWVLVSLAYQIAPTLSEDRRLVFSLIAELPLAIAYGAYVLAAERQPNRRSHLRPAGLERTLTWPSITVFVSGLLVYFVIVPALLDPEEYASFLPSMCLYISLDLYLIGRFAYLARDAQRPRWRFLYTLLMLNAVGMLGADLLETLVHYLPTVSWGTLIDPFYTVQTLPMILAARLRHLHIPSPPPVSKATNDPLADWRIGPTMSTVIAAFAFPTVHFACYFFGILGEETKDIRQTLALFWMLALGTIATLQHWLLGRRARTLWSDWQRAEKALRRSEQRARVLAQRADTRKALESAQKKFTLAFEATPTPLAIFTRSDGRFRAVNRAFTLLTGYRGQQVVGKTAHGLGLWNRPRDAARMRKDLRKHGSVPGREVELRAQDNTLRRVRLAAEPVNLHGSPSLVVVLRDLSGDLEEFADLAAGEPWLQDLVAGLCVVDDHGKITHWSTQAEELFDLPREVAIGCHASGLLGGLPMTPGLFEGEIPHGSGRRTIRGLALERDGGALLVAWDGHQGTQQPRRNERSDPHRALGLPPSPPAGETP